MVKTSKLHNLCGSLIFIHLLIANLQQSYSNKKMQQKKWFIHVIPEVSEFRPRISIFCKRRKYWDKSYGHIEFRTIRNETILGIRISSLDETCR
jgi:hypothetical protein